MLEDNEFIGNKNDSKRNVLQSSGPDFLILISHSNFALCSIPCATMVLFVKLYFLILLKKHYAVF